MLAGETNRPRSGLCCAFGITLPCTGRLRAFQIVLLPPTALLLTVIILPETSKLEAYSFCIVFYC